MPLEQLTSYDKYTVNLPISFRRAKWLGIVNVVDNFIDYLIGCGPARSSIPVGNIVKL